ncbi:MAG: hypothetical protein CSA24_01465 [Deltaproteobacteria bacterium]|nr:MAG: hypothetical protein CSA24_01465 [Deltaproteobacteria bacterium]
MLATPLPRPALAVATLLGLLGACADAGVTGDSGMCSADDDCADGLRCDQGHCVAQGVNALTVHARIVPPTSSGLLAQQVPALSFDEGSDRLIRLIAPATIKGVVRHSGDSFNPNIPGEIEARAAGDIPGIDHRFSATSWDGVNEQGFGFILDLMPGRYYAATFRASDRTLPPFEFTITPEDLEAGTLEITLPALSDYLRLDGRVRRADYTPVASARVVALDEASEVLASVMTEEVRGKFQLVLPPKAGKVRLKVQSPGDGPVFPDFVTDPIAPMGEVDITIPALPTGTEPFEARLRVVALDASNAPAPLPSVTVTIVGDLAGGTLRRTATTNSEGVARIETLPGAYECLVTTPPNSPWASWHGRVTLAAFSASDGGPTEVLLDHRVPLFGLVGDAAGDPIEKGVLYASRRVARAAGDTLAIASPTWSVDIGLGEFQLLVDPGVYDLRVVPDAATGAPVTRIDGVEIGEGGRTLTLDLPAPALAHLTVADPDGDYLEGATIELYLPVETDDNTTTSDAPPLLVKGATGDRGYVDLLIPHVP